jgi:hypothetical protein
MKDNIPTPSSASPAESTTALEPSDRSLPQALGPVDSLERKRILDWFAKHSLEKVAQLMAAPRPAGFGVTLTIPQLEDLRFSLETFERWFRIVRDGESAHPISQEYEHLFPTLNRTVTLLLLQRVYESIRGEHFEFTYVKLWHTLLVNHLKLGIESVQKDILLSPAQQQEKIWDIFALPEDERARRRAKLKSEPKQLQP